MTAPNRLIWLVRHARAQLAEAGERDFDRPLSADGQTQARQLRDWLALRCRDRQQATVLVSPAQRTRETAQAAFASADRITIQIESKLWEAGRSDVYRLIQSQPGDLVLIGHNPGMELAAGLLSHQRLPMATGSAIEFAELAPEEYALRARFQPESDLT